MPQRPTNARSTLRAVLLGLAATAALAASAAGQTTPRPLPSPDVPVERLPPAVAPGALPGYQGPPAVIDGPAMLEPGGFGQGAATEDIPPGLAAPSMLEPELNALPGEPLGEPIIDELLAAEQPYYMPQKLNPYKSGFFQKLSLSAAWFGNSNDADDLGGTEIETYLTVALPAPIVEWPLLITPTYNMTFIDGPTVTDVPARLYFAQFDLQWLPLFVNRYRMLLSVAPSVFGDFEQNEFRLTGKALLIYDWVPERLQFIAGVLYLNRDNVNLLPAGGVIWTPADWARFEILFPKPKFGLRYNVGLGFEDWIYTTAEFGGNTWPIERASGAADDFTYVDYRILLGIERKMEGGAGYRLEAGYVFGREVEFGSGIGDFSPQDTILIRGGIMY